MGLMSKFIPPFFTKKSKQLRSTKAKEVLTTSREDFLAAKADTFGAKSICSTNSGDESEESARVMAAGKRFFECTTNQDAEGLKACATAGCEVTFRDQELGLEGFAEEAVKIWKAFPDFHLTNPNGFQLKKDENGELYCVTSGCVPNGHHTGAPYGFGPYEPIPITNKYVKNAPETFHFYVNDEGKVYRVLIDADGEMTGPAGVYQQIGGFPIL
jgi:hypothetical protein